jgi:hypothetical protein
MFDLKLTSLLSLGIIVSLLLAFNENAHGNTTKSPQSTETQTTSNNLRKAKTQTLRGKLIYEEIPPVRSVRSYQGEEFFLIINRNKIKRLVLRPSKQVPEAKLKSFHNQQVEIKVVYQRGMRPFANEVACPLDINGQCLPQGEGYQVLSIIPIIPR